MVYSRCGSDCEVYIYAGAIYMMIICNSAWSKLSIDVPDSIEYFNSLEELYPRMIELKDLGVLVPDDVVSDIEEIIERNKRPLEAHWK